MQAGQKRSTFVTVVGWIFTALSGFGTFMGALISLVVVFMVNDPDFQQMLEDAIRSIPSDVHVPPALAFMLDHVLQILPLASISFLLVSVVVLIISIGLLRRWNWARLCFIALMALSIVEELAELGFRLLMLSPAMRALFIPQFADAAAQGGSDIDTGPFMVISTVINVTLSILFTIGFCILFGWIAKKLMSAPVRAEFRRA